MAFDFYIGKFRNGEGLDKGLSRGIEPVTQSAVRQFMLLTRAFVVGGQHHHGGERWAPLAASTIKRKGHSMILVDTGRLRRSISFKTIRSMIDGYIVDIGTNVPYARYHQHGGKNLPKRPVAVITKEDELRIAENFSIWAEKALNGDFRNRLDFGKAT